MRTPAASPDSGLFRGTTRPIRHAGLAILVGWAPLAVATAAEGLAFGTPGLGSFTRDLAVHARSLVAAPLLILADAVCTPRLSGITFQFLDAGLIPDHHRPRFEQVVVSTRRWHGSPVASAILVALAYGLALGIYLLVPPARHADWQVGPWGHSIAAWWHGLVSLPLLLVLILFWSWRLCLWGRLLWLVSRMELRLVPSHPDRCAGLRFVGHSLRAFALVALALGTLGAGRMANNAVHLGITPFAHRYAVLLGTAAVVVIFLSPLLVFTPTLIAEWRRGVFQYGGLASRLGQEFEQKWLAGRRSPPEPGLQAPDFSAVIDAFSIVGNAYAMRLVPVDLKSIALLGGAVLLPFVPLAVLSLPLDAIVRTLARFFV